jgi:hypothetical protein
MPANKPGWGGRRPNQTGRPLGAKNRLPHNSARERARNAGDFERVQRLISDSVASEYLQTGPAALFEGNAADFLVSVYRCEKLPVKVRLYAAREALSYEPNPADGALLDQLFANASIMDELKSNHAERLRERDAQLRRWIEAGRADEAIAVEIRNLYADDDHQPWQPLPPKPVALLAPPTETDCPQNVAPSTGGDGENPAETLARDGEQSAYRFCGQSGRADVGPENVHPADTASARQPSDRQRKNAARPTDYKSVSGQNGRPGGDDARLPPMCEAIVRGNRAAEPEREPSPADRWLSTAPHLRREPLVLFGPPFARFQGASGTLYIDDDGTGRVIVVDENDARTMMRNGYVAR